MFCKKCGAEVSNDAEFCQSCGEKVAQGTNSSSEEFSGNQKIFCILSYVGILWLIGLLVSPEKDNARVRFHVGQGMIATITSVAVSICVTIVNGVIRIVTSIPFGYESFLVSGITSLISLCGFAVTFGLLVVGILNVVNNKDEKLPIVGGFSFYK